MLLTSFVMSASIPSTCHEHSGGFLADALWGGAIGERKAADATVERLNDILEGLPEVIVRQLGNTEASGQAILELNRVIELPTTTPMAVYAKRAAVLYALWREPDVQEHFRSTGEGALVDDLVLRVLPLVMPKFVAAQCQTPDALVVSAVVMHTMWDGQDLKLAVPHLKSAPRQDDQAGNGEA